MQRRDFLSAMAAAAAACVTPSSRADQPLETFTAFQSGTEGYHTYRIPAVVITRRGTLLAFCEGRKTGRGDYGDIDIVLKRSVDGGRTWGPVQLVHDDGGDARVTIGAPTPVVDDATGTVWIAFARDYQRTFLASSPDEGQTWHKAEVTDVIRRGDWTYYSFGPGNGVQLRRGPHAGRLIIPAKHRVGPLTEANRVHKDSHSHVIYSDDHGRTWQIGGAAGLGTNEVSVAELDGGRLMLNMRNYIQAGLRAVCTSDDGGLSWSPTRYDAQLVAPPCQANLLRYTFADTHGRSRLLFCSPTPNKRANLTVRLSYDEGQTWPVSRVIQPGPAAYCNLVVLPDMTIGCMYEGGEKSMYETLRFARFSLDWLTQGKDHL